MTGLNGDREAVEKLVDAALASLEANRARIDDLNVYPVPDGDTGTNLTMTVRAVADAVDHTSAASRQSLARGKVDEEMSVRVGERSAHLDESVSARPYDFVECLGKLGRPIDADGNERDVQISSRRFESSQTQVSAWSRFDVDVLVVDRRNASVLRRGLLQQLQSLAMDRGPCVVHDSGDVPARSGKASRQPQ